MIVRQTWSVVQMAIASIPQRLGSSAVVVVGIAAVVAVLVAILAMAAGFERTLKQTGTDDTAIVLAAGARSETGSTLDRDTVAVASDAPQVLRNAQNQPIGSAEQLVSALLPKKSTKLDAGVAIRGVGEHVWELWPHVRIVAGRRFHAALRELVVGSGVHEKFLGADVGSTLTLDGQPWTVVGIFDSGDAHNSEVWTDGQVIASAYHRGASTTSLTVKLTDARAFEAFKAVLQSDPRLKVAVQTTRQFYNAQSQTFARMIRLVGATIGAIMALGAIFGALNATYTAIAGRTREIATLRAIGFQQVTVIISVLAETLLLATLGGALGAALTWALFDGFTASTVGASGQIVFAFRVTPGLLWNGIEWALAIGLIGGIIPALRAARMSVTAGLRAV